MSSVRVYVDLDDVSDEMDRLDKQNMGQWLYEDGFLQTHTNLEIRKLMRSKEESFGEKELLDHLTKIGISYYQLSNEDCELIKQIANKL